MKQTLPEYQPSLHEKVDADVFYDDCCRIIKAYQTDQHGAALMGLYCVLSKF